jgi:hypothetical protein
LHPRLGVSPEPGLSWGWSSVFHFLHSAGQHLTPSGKVEPSPAPAAPTVWKEGENPPELAQSPPPASSAHPPGRPPLAPGACWQTPLGYSSGHRQGIYRERTGHQGRVAVKSGESRHQSWPHSPHLGDPKLQSPYLKMALTMASPT